MHKNRHALRIVTLAALVACFLVIYSRINSPEDQYESNKFTGLTMGTFYRIEIVADNLTQLELRSIKAKVDAVLGGVDRIMSTYKPDSDISRFNSSRSVEEFTVAESLAHVTAAALIVAYASNGAFDPTVGPLVDLWGFGSEAATNAVPTVEQITKARARIGYTRLSVTDLKTLKKSIPSLNLDLSAVAKGAGVDMTLFLLNDLGYSNVLVEVGGEIAVSGHNKRGKDWMVSVETPEMDAGVGEGRYVVLRLAKGAIATSGDYRNYREEDGRNYSHVIDPRTGYPVSNGVASVTVIAQDCMTADALATTLMVLGPEQGLDFMIGQNGADAMIIVRSDTGDYRDYRTAGFGDYVFENR